MEMDNSRINKYLDIEIKLYERQFHEKDVSITILDQYDYESIETYFYNKYYKNFIFKLVKIYSQNSKNKIITDVKLFGFTHVMNFRKFQIAAIVDFVTDTLHIDNIINDKDYLDLPVQRYLKDVRRDDFKYIDPQLRSIFLYYKYSGIIRA